MNSFNILLCVFYYTLPFAVSEYVERVKVSHNDGVHDKDLETMDEHIYSKESSVEVVKDPTENKQYQSEIARGDMADLFSTNIHKSVPPNFPDFGRRFVLQYPYSKKSASQIDDEAEEHLDKIIREALKNAEADNKQEDRLRPVKASPQLVLAVARHAALSQDAQSNKNDQVLSQQALRNGDYWNSVWKEDVPNPKSSLRSEKRLESVRVKIMPGSKLYQLVSMTKDLSPKLLYVINNSIDEE